MTPSSELPAEAANYERPPMALLSHGRFAPGTGRALDAMRDALESTLRQFGVPARVSRVSRGPTVTRFELVLEPGVNASSVTELEAHLANALETAEIRIVSPIPGRSAIGIEVPNHERDLITLGDVLQTSEAEAQTHPLTAGIGVDIAGNAVLVNLARLPHLLIAGATAAGKSTALNAIVMSLVMRARPSEVRLILVDPKRVELTAYEGVPHLLTPVVTDPARAVAALQWTVKEMNDRYERLSLLGYRNLDGYNDAARRGTARQASALSGGADTQWDELPYIVVAIDGADRVLEDAAAELCATLCQQGHTAGIHVVLSVSSAVSPVSRELLRSTDLAALVLRLPKTDIAILAGEPVALLGATGNAAFKIVGQALQCFTVPEVPLPDVRAAVAHCRSQCETVNASGTERGGQHASQDVQSDDMPDVDLIRAARDLVIRSGLGSTSMLQRKLRIGFARAARIMDELERLGVVGPSEGPGARHVLVTLDVLADIEALEAESRSPALMPFSAAPAPARPRRRRGLRWAGAIIVSVILAEITIGYGQELFGLILVLGCFLLIYFIFAALFFQVESFFDDFRQPDRRRRR